MLTQCVVFTYLPLHQPLFHFWFNTRFVLPDAKNDRNVRLVLTKVTAACIRHRFIWSLSPVTIWHA